MKKGDNEEIKKNEGDTSIMKIEKVDKVSQEC